ncbi:hypothetical protein [Hymenobacter sp. APR13]|uniref:hypothetical protein n=1 Tax=Hymenobacter sp. APR13 TaxID=1356852 RepID=UPI0012E098A7|nr:hypothetical protein [Hymenobacter sp. APR13]
MLYPAVLPPGFSPTLNISMQVGTVVITTAQWFAIRTDYRWVKTLTVIFIAVGVLGYVFRLPILNESTPKTALFLVSSSLQAWVAFILFKDLIRRPVAGEAEVA